MIHPAELIGRKRNGEELPADEIAELILGYARGDVPDYQLAAFCMALYFRGMTPAETYALTDAMIRSGRTLELGRALGRKVVDKHSTGGVGDKTSLAVGPIVALSPTPPVECLSTTLRPSSAPRSSVAPLRTIASVSADVSAGVSPRNQTAIKKAAIW